MNEARALAFVLVFTCACAAPPAGDGAAGEWPAYGRDAGGSRY